MFADFQYNWYCILGLYKFVFKNREFEFTVLEYFLFAQ